MSNVANMQVSFYKSNFQRYDIIAPNIYLDWQYNEMDIFALRKGSGYVDEIEIKTSKSDFLADFKKTVKVEDGVRTLGVGHTYPKYTDKPKHDALIDGLPHCNYFSFLIPESLYNQCDIPEHAGLYIYQISRNGIGRIEEIKKAPLLHKRKISEIMKFNVGRKMAYRYWNKIEGVTF